ncbi:sulfatase [Novipirellula rosea]
MNAIHPQPMSPTPRRLFRMIACLFALASLMPEGATADQRPNVLWIVLDDLGPEIGCYGMPHVSTPAMDRLASEGVRYTRCFSTSPVCSSSRSAIVTGMYQTSIGAHHHRTRQMKPLPEGVQTVMQQFGDAGYFVCDLKPPGVKGKAKRDYNFIADDGLFHGDDWSERREGQPFFAQVQIHEPHRPFVHNQDPERAAKLSLSAKYPDHPVARADMADYLASVEKGDQHVAAILERLEAEGLRENTLIMLFGDHGRPHVWGKQWLYDEGLHTPLIVAGPMITNPGTSSDLLVSLIDVAPTCLRAANITPHARTEGVNILAADFKGREFVFAARDRCGEAADRIRAIRDTRYKYIRNFYPDRPYTQTSSYKLLSYPVVTLLDVLHAEGKLAPDAERMMQKTRPAEELYDLQTDPDELHNLAENPEHESTLQRMRTQLNQWIETSGDQGAIREGDQAYHDAITAEKRKWYENTQRKRGLDPNLSAEQYLEWWKKELRLSTP